MAIQSTMTIDTARGVPGRALLRDVESEVTDLAVLDEIVLALQPQAAGLLEDVERALGGDQLVVAVHLGADEATRDVGVDGRGGVLRPGAGRDRPRPDLVLPNREKRYETEERETLAEHSVDGRLGQPQIGQERLLLGALERSDLGLDDRGDPAHARVRTPGDLGQAVALGDLLALRDRLLLDVHQVENRLLREERKTAD